VWDASRLIDPPNPPTSPGGWVYPLMDGHPHRCSTDFEQTLLGGHLTRRVLIAHESTSPLGYVSIFGETSEPTLGWKEGSGAITE
jgi:hypothetical protein